MLCPYCRHYGTILKKGRREYLNDYRRNGDTMHWETSSMAANVMVFGEDAREKCHIQPANADGLNQRMC